MKKETSVPRESDRDRTVERLLRVASPTDPSMAVTPECVDAETLAVWMAGELPPAAASRVESHLSTCARCQATMAVFARIEPAAAAARVPFWQRPAFGWIAPLATAAAVTIWFALPKGPEPTTTAPESTVARMGQSQNAAPSSAAATSRDNKDTLTKKEDQRAEASSKTRSARADAPKLDTRTQANAVAAAPAQAPAGALGEVRATTAPPPPPASGSATPLPGTPAPPPRPTAPPPVVVAGATEPVFRAGATPPPATATPTPTPSVIGVGAAQSQLQITLDGVALSQAERVMLGRVEPVIEIVSADPASELTKTATAAAGAGGGGGGGGRAGGGGGRGGGGARLAAAPSPTPMRARWHILNGIKVERSIDDGKNWEAIVIDPPAVLIAGSAPSPAVCWLVGRAGAIMLATDGLRFTRVISPGPIDFKSVRATSARDASVTAVDGRVFVTSDGGVTWRIQ